jgi:hypothetical protein
LDLPLTFRRDHQLYDPRKDLRAFLQTDLRTPKLTGYTNTSGWLDCHDQRVVFTGKSYWDALYTLPRYQTSI